MFTKRIIILIFLFGATFVSRADNLQPNKSVLKIQHWQTKNGAEVYYVASPEIPMVQINVMFAAGSSRDGEKAGLAQFTNNMLNQGARDLTADQIAAQFDNVGAQYSSNVNRDIAIVSLQSLTDPKYLNPAVSTFSKILTTPTFPQDGFDRTKNQTLTGIASENQSPKAIATNAFYAATYGNHPYHNPVIGTTDSINSLAVTNLVHFYNQYYVAKNAILTIVGAVDKSQAENIANQITENLSSGNAAPALPLAQPNSAAVRDNRIKFPSEQTTIMMGQVGINYQSPDYFPLFVGNTILGGSIFSSRLFNEVREKRGLAYGVGSAFKPLAARGPFAIVLQTRNDEASQAVQVTRDTLNNFVSEGPTDAEMTRTKSQINNNFPLSLAGNDAISDYLMTIGFYKLPLNYLDTYLQKINAVTIGQVKTALKNNIQTDKLITIMVGNGAKAQ